jgi:hypothetical protein
LEAEEAEEAEEADDLVVSDCFVWDCKVEKMGMVLFQKKDLRTSISEIET